uniref:Phosphoglucomutase n=1 Tax=Cucumis melo TaxID=3656 RepID=A0A9I9EIS2_CUCME
MVSEQLDKRNSAKDVEVERAFDDTSIQVDGSVASKQGVRFVFSDGSRIIYRLSGTGSAGATVRIYIEQFEPDISKHDVDAQISLKPLIDLALSLSKLEEFTGREKPTGRPHPTFDGKGKHKKLKSNLVVDNKRNLTTNVGWIYFVWKS